MKIEKKRLELHSVVKFDIKENENLYEKIDSIKARLLNEGAYTTSPVIYRYNTSDKCMELFFQISSNVLESVMEKFEVLSEIMYEECLFTRFIKENESIEEIMQEVSEYAEQNDYLLESPYFVLIPIPNGNVLDVFWPINN